MTQGTIYPRTHELAIITSQNNLDFYSTVYVSSFHVKLLYGTFRQDGPAVCRISKVDIKLNGGAPRQSTGAAYYRVWVVEP